MPADPFLSRLLAALKSADADEAAALYSDDAAMLSLEWTAEGRDAIRDRYGAFFDYHGSVEQVDVDRSQRAGDRLFAEFTLQSERGRFQLVNALLLDGNHARVHFSNVVDLTLNEDEVQVRVG